jgi:monofunctional glycosyltransferase
VSAKPRISGLRKLLKWLGFLIGFIVLALLVLQLWFFGHVLWYRDHNPESTSFMRIQYEALKDKDPEVRLRHQWIPYPKISKHLKNAVLAAEDANFTDHDGVDWDSIEAAYEKNIKKGKIMRGGSTITMQLAKNLFLSGERSYVRKAQELIITYMIEAVMEKERILEIYLNVAEWGVGVFGCEEGAQHYFKISAAQLSSVQAARMAAMLPRPRFYDLNRTSRTLSRRAAMIMRGMGSVEAP